MTENESAAGLAAATPGAAANGSDLSLLDLLTWIGEGKRLILAVTAGVAVVAVGLTLVMSEIFTAQATLLPPNSQQGGGSMAALAALSSLGSLGGLAGGLGGAKTPDELYVALLKSDHGITHGYAN